MVLKGSQVRQLLDDLCVHVGFCLPPADQLRLQDSVPSDPDAFTDAVFRAEGLDPSTADRHLYRQARTMVRHAFHRAEGR